MLCLQKRAQVSSDWSTLLSQKYTFLWLLGDRCHIYLILSFILRRIPIRIAFTNILLSSSIWFHCRVRLSNSIASVSIVYTFRNLRFFLRSPHCLCWWFLCRDNTWALFDLIWWYNSINSWKYFSLYYQSFNLILYLDWCLSSRPFNSS